MSKRYVLIALSAVWVVLAGFIGIATLSLVGESGWGELPVYAWLLLGALGGALLALVYSGYRWLRA